MNPIKAIVSRNELLAALLFASNDDSRYVLNSVFVEVKPGKLPLVVACDGRRLAVIQTKATQEQEFAEDHSYLLRSSFVKPLCALSRSLGGKNFPWIGLENAKGSDRLTATFIGAHSVMKVEKGAFWEGNFPDWRKVIPDGCKRTPVSEMGFNSEFLGAFSKAAKMLDSKPGILLNLIDQESQVEVKLETNPDFYGVIMPLKFEATPNYQPEFLKAPIQKAA